MLNVTKERKDFWDAKAGVYQGMDTALVLVRSAWMCSDSICLYIWQRGQL
jgi:hypothetical protein